MKKLTTLIFAFVFTLLALSNTTYASNWQWIISSDTTTFEMDMSSIKKESIGSYPTTIYYKFWIRHTYNQGGVQEEIDTRRKHGLAIDGFENLSHAIYRGECKYEKGYKYIRAVSWIYYDNKGRGLTPLESQNVSWDEIIPDTVSEIIYDAVVKNS